MSTQNIESKPAQCFVLSKLWLVLFAVTMSTVWLLPNHYLPWSSFHMDAWVAILMCVASIFIIFKSPNDSSWDAMTLMAVVLACLPLLQYVLGIVTFAGVAWINISYMVGFLLALHVGKLWERATPGQLGDTLFLAIGIASLASVGLQLYQWFQLDGIDIWSMGLGQGRPYANFGQPNQLATFLLWGLLAFCWGAHRGYISFFASIFAASFLLLGLAMTASRTAWLALLFFVTMAWVWRKYCPLKSMPWVVTVLGLFFVLCGAALEPIGDLLGITAADPFHASRMVPGMRTQIWALLVTAAFEHPFLGYGWGQVVEAQLTQANKFPPIHVVFTHSHNLFLDLALWSGIPIAVVIIFLLVGWLFEKFKRVGSPRSALMLLFVLVPLNHAMLELPLHYAYFLLPLGLMMGAMDSKHQILNGPRAGRKTLLSIWIVATVLLVIVIKDYAKVERSYLQMRFFQSKPTAFEMPDVPNVIILTQWREFIKLVNYEPHPKISTEEIEWMRELTQLYPSAGFSQKLATGYAYKDEIERAQRALKLACKVNTISQCEALKHAWNQQSLTNQYVAKVTWPE